MGEIVVALLALTDAQEESGRLLIRSSAISAYKERQLTVSIEMLFHV